MITGNRGEWSEAYTFLKLLADGKLYAADSDLNKIENIFYPIIKIIRSEAGGTWEFKRNSEIHILNAKTEKTLLKIPASAFIDNATLLLRKIKNSTGTFSVPEIEEFMKAMKCTTLKAKSIDKSDIKIMVHDFTTGLTPTLGFSIKSNLGSASTLLNPGGTTNFIYKLTGNSLSNGKVKEINHIKTKSKIRDRVKAIENEGARLEFIGMENENFFLNLQMIDTALPEIIAQILLSFFRGDAALLKDLANSVSQHNPCNFNHRLGHQFYEYKIKAFLTDVALGMTPSKRWTGKYDATGGYIIVRDDGEVVCYHIYNRNEFQDYLLKNTRLESASSSRHGYGLIYKQGNDLFIKLNLQVRFT